MLRKRPVKHASKAAIQNFKHASSLLSTMKAVAKRQVKLAGVQKKVSYNFSSNIGSAGIILPVAFLTKGVEQYQREGTKILPDYMEWRGVFKGDSTPAVMRVILGVYHEVGGTLPAVSDILQHVINTGTANTTYNAPYNINKRSEFRILSDRMLYLSGFTGISRLAAGTPNQTADTFANAKGSIYHKKVKLRGSVRYTLAGNAGTIADVQDGLPFMLLITDNNTNLPTYDIRCDFAFRDA